MRRGHITAFIIAELLLYAAFLALDLTGRFSASVWLKYGGVLLCLLFSALCAHRGGDRLVPAALCLTAAADCFLLVLNAHYALGVLIFLGAQSAYLFRLRLQTGRAWPVLRALVPLAAGLLLFPLGQASPLNLLAGLYFSQLLVNAAIAWSVPGCRWRLFALGLTLFIGCDLCVGAFNAPALFPAAVYSFARFGMWAFYLPSQMLIALSALPEKEF